ncbi:MAG: hypothetical protein AAGD09_24945 [Cyanobacteria bacterium P01_F01_bin.56]
MAQIWVSNALLIVGISLSPFLWLVVMGWFIHSALNGLHRQLTKLQQQRTMPCFRCAYFSGCEQLKCAVNPYSALTGAAKDCRDFTLSSAIKDTSWWHHKL